MADIDAKIPAPPTLAEAAFNIKDVMKSNPQQATQIMTALGVVKNAKRGSYQQYVQLCKPLNVQPISEERWAAHDKSGFKQLIAASIAQNLPGCKLEEGDLERILDASSGDDPMQAGGTILGIVLKRLNATSDVTKQWIDLGEAALNLVL